MATCKKCGAVEQEREVIDRVFRKRKEGPPPGDGWIGPIYPNAEVQIFERKVIEQFFDCKLACPHAE